MTTHGHFHWNELVTRDVEKAKKFYGDTIGWTFDGMPMPDGTYWVAKMGAAFVGGLFPISGPQWEGVRSTGCPISRSTTSMRASRKHKQPAPN
jgi:predicted enzyme related to lactoylglutathione lyase